MKRSKNIFDKIGSLIPGYRGYAERDLRRDCDKLLRTQLSTKLLSFQKKVDKEIKKLIDLKEFDELVKYESLRKKINTLAGKIEFAPYGESAFFSSNLIKEDQLEKIYEFDYEILFFIDNKMQNIDSNILDCDIDKAYLLLEKRNEYVKGFV